MKFKDADSKMAQGPSYKALQRRIEQLERELAQCKLRETTLVEMQDFYSSEKNLSDAIVKSMPGIFYLFDEKLRLNRWNKNHEIVSGYSADESDGMTPYDFFEGDDIEIISKAVDKVMEQGSATTEANFKTKEGTKIPYLLSGSRLTLDNKRFLLGMGFDLSLQKQGEEALLNAKRRLSDILDFLPDATFAIDTAGKVVFWNRAIEALSGVKAEDMLGKGDYEYAIPFYGSRRPTLIDLSLHWDDEIAQKYTYVEKKGDMLVSETVNPAFMPEPSCFWNSSRKLYDIHGRVIGAIEVIRDISERSRMEEELRLKEKQYRILLEAASHSGQAIVIHQDKNDLEAACVYANQAAVRLIGRSAEELKHVSWFDLIPRDQRKAARQRYDNRLKGEDLPELFQISILDKDSREVPIEITAIRSRYQEDVAVVSFFRDIAARKHAEEELQASERRFRGLVANIPGTVYRCDGDAHWTMHYLSESIVDICGYPASDFIGNKARSYTSIIHPDDRRMVEKAVAQSIQDNAPFTIEYRIYDANGNQRWVYESGMPIVGENQAVGYLDGVIFDITERKQMEQSLRESEGRYRALFESANDAILFMKHEVFIDCNQKTLEIFGCSRDQIIGQPPYLFSPPNQPDGPASKDKALAKIEAVLSGRPQTFEWLHQRLDGSTFEAQVSLNLVELKTGMHIQAIVRDITAQKKADAERKRLEAQLYQSQKLEAVGTLAGGIAHDFNNILSAVIGYAEIALDDELPEDAPARNSLKNVLKAGFRAKDLVKQILTFSRRGKGDTTPISICSIVKESLKLLRASLPSNIEIRQHLPAADVEIMGDTTQIHQVLMNLCSNAGYAMRDTGGCLDVAVSEISYGQNGQDPDVKLKPGNYVKLVVSDTGPGMTPAVMERVFDPFFTTKPKEEGTGLGLSVVHGIVKGHGGAITMASELGSGATVTVYLPQIVPSTERSQEPEESLPTGSERILLVDDEEAVVVIWTILLENLGYTVVSASSSLAALEIFTADPKGFDLVITDQTMPELTGDQLAVKIMAIRPETPIILSTGYSYSMSEDRAKSIGIREFILKPVVRRDLAVAVRRALDR